ncbi:MAG: hypothetical protein AAGA29_11275 [Planctomycetota bacterium]
MGRILPKTLVDFYEPRVHRDWLRLTVSESRLTRREALLVRCFFLFLAIAFLTTPYLHWWIAQQTPGSVMPTMRQVHLHSFGGTALFVALGYSMYRLRPWVYNRCRVRIRITDQFIQRFHVGGGPAVFWKHAERASLEAVSLDGNMWTVLIVHSTKRTHPLHIGIPNDQPIEPICEVIADQGVPLTVAGDNTPT